MEIISKAIVDGTMQDLERKLATEMPNTERRYIVAPTGNRRLRRAKAAKQRKAKNKKEKT